jgi:hypothetical protein
MMIESVEVFDGIVEEMREMLANRVGQDWPDAEVNIRVPSGPVEHW